MVNVGIAGPGGHAIEDSPVTSQLPKLNCGFSLAPSTSAPSALLAVDSKESKEDDQRWMCSLDFNGPFEVTLRAN